jgi:IclR family acetate operon transcriptional repressor
MPTRSSSPDDAASPAPVARLFDVLKLIASMGMASAADIVYMLDIPRPTAHRLVNTLSRMQLIQKMPVKGKYAVAPKLLDLATSILHSTVVYVPLQTLLNDLARKTGETCSLAVMSTGGVEYIASAIGHSPLTLQFQAGQKTPLHCTSSGRVLLASLDEETLSRFLSTGPWESVTPFSTTDPKVLRRKVLAVRTDGYALNDSEYVVGVVGVAVPVKNGDGDVVAALTLSAPKSRHTAGDMAKLVPTIRGYASRVSRII